MCANHFHTSCISVHEYRQPSTLPLARHGSGSVRVSCPDTSAVSDCFLRPTSYQSGLHSHHVTLGFVEAAPSIAPSHASFRAQGGSVQPELGKPAIAVRNLNGGRPWQGGHLSACGSAPCVVCEPLSAIYPCLCLIVTTRLW